MTGCTNLRGHDHHYHHHDDNHHEHYNNNDDDDDHHHDDNDENDVVVMVVVVVVVMFVVAIVVVVVVVVVAAAYMITNRVSLMSQPITLAGFMYHFKNATDWGPQWYEHSRQFAQYEDDARLDGAERRWANFLLGNLTRVISELRKRS